MSTSKLDRSGVFQPVVLKSDAICLTLPVQTVRVRKNGIEFLSSSPVPAWTEVKVDLLSPDGTVIKGNGVVVACDGSRHSGYVVSLMFMSLSPQAQARLGLLATR